MCLSVFLCIFVVVVALTSFQTVCRKTGEPGPMHLILLLLIVFETVGTEEGCIHVYVVDVDIAFVIVVVVVVLNSSTLTRARRNC